MRVVPAEPRDAAEWARMRHALWPDGSAESHAEEVAQFFDGTLRMPLAALVALDDAGRPVGFAELFIRNCADECTTDRVAYLEGWYVEPHARRHGVGRALIQASEAWARAQGCTEFGSDALIDNELSAVAHRALGFRETGQLRTFLKRLDG